MLLTISTGFLNQAKIKHYRSISHCIKLLFILNASSFLQECYCTTNPTSNHKTSSGTNKGSQPVWKTKSTTDSNWIQASLNRHNYLRSLHNAQPLALNTSLCEIAQAWSNYLLAESLKNIKQKDDVVQGKFFFEHNYASNQKYFIGENLYYSTHSKGVRLNGSIAVTLWYDEIKDYDFTFARVKATSRPGSLIGHFTQVVWKNSNQMGTAYSTGSLPTGQLVTFVVANYYPSGNVIHGSKFPQKLYIQNVVPPINDAENEIENVTKVIQDKIKYWEITTNGITTPQAWIDVALDKHLSSVAQASANQLLIKGVKDFNMKWTIDGYFGFKNYAVTEKAQFGESVIYFIGDGGGIDPQYFVMLFYQQYRFYDFENYRPNFNKSRTASTNEFEQMMWKSTTHLGIAYASQEAENGQMITFVVCYYYPKGPQRDATLEEKKLNLPPNSSNRLTCNTCIMIFVLIYFIV